jgi:hypothetical protein
VTWQKGESGNKTGISPKHLALKRRLEGLTFKAVKVLDDILSDKTASHGERLSAAKEVFDRAIGKAKQQATLEVTHNASPHLSALIGLATMTTIEGSLADRGDRGNHPVHLLAGQSPNMLITLDNLDVNADAEGGDNG